MAGRPLGMRSLMKTLSRYSRAQLKKLIDAIPKEDNRVARLKAKREKHLAALKRLDRQIAKFSGGNGAVATSSKPGRKPGRRKGYKLSAATRRKMSEAAKRRYAGKGKAEAAQVTGMGKRKPFSAETKAKMAAAQKARWARIKTTRS